MMFGGPGGGVGEGGGGLAMGAAGEPPPQAAASPSAIAPSPKRSGLLRLRGPMDLPGGDGNPGRRSTQPADSFWNELAVAGRWRLLAGSDTAWE
jgi:hypothetical protein